MKQDRRGSLAGGILLILIGAVFLAHTLAPQVTARYLGANSWPLIILGLGVAFLIAGLISATGGFLIPGAILSGIGGLLYYQNLSGDWASWAYAWPLAPGFVGLGLLLASLVDPGARGARRVGLYMAGIALALFAILWSLFTASVDLDYIWPVALILVGLAILAGAVFRK